MRRVTVSTAVAIAFIGRHGSERWEEEGLDAEEELSLDILIREPLRVVEDSRCYWHHSERRGIAAERG